MSGPRRTTGQPKKIAYELIPHNLEWGRQMYEQLYQLVDAHHDELAKAEARIALAWSLAWKADVDGRLTLGKCKKASELDRTLMAYDFIILLNRDFWQNPHVTPAQRAALLDHELHHCGISRDVRGEPKVDTKGRVIYRIVKHTIEEFVEVVARHGCYKADLEAFMRALTRAEASRTDGFVGYTALSTLLVEIGYDVEPLTVATWTAQERREVHGWALLRRETGLASPISQTVPACLARAVASTPTGQEQTTASDALKTNEWSGGPPDGV